MNAKQIERIQSLLRFAVLLQSHSRPTSYQYRATMETTSESGRVKNLQKMVGKTLEANGELSKIRASLRLQILNVLRGTEQSTSLTNFHENEWPHYNLIHEMIMEYFQWMKYNYSAEIFAAEIGHEKSKMVRNHLEEQLEAIFQRKVHMRKDVPMLLNLLFDN